MSHATGRQSAKEAVEALLRQKAATGEPWTDSEKEFLRSYEGGGGIKGATGRGVIDEFYTPTYLVSLMWMLAKKHGYQRGTPVLEPSCGPGRFFADAPPDSPLVGFEINPFSYQIAKVLYPEATLYHDYFETAFLEPDRFTTRIKGAKPTWLKDYPFGLVIGNPPYGVYKNQYSGYFKSPKVYQIENFFMYYGLQLLGPGGLLIYLTSSNFMRNGEKYNSIKEKIGEISQLVDAVRLPSVFKNSKVPVDILIFKRRYGNV